MEVVERLYLFQTVTIGKQTKIDLNCHAIIKSALIMLKA